MKPVCVTKNTMNNIVCALAGGLWQADKED